MAKDDSPTARTHRLTITIAMVVVALAVIGLTIYLATQPTTMDPADGLPRPLTPAERAVMQSRMLLEQGQVAEALDLLKTYLENHPADVTVRPTLAQIYLQSGQLDQAEAEIDRMLELAGDHPVALWHKGLLVQHRGGQGEPYFRQAADHPQAGVKVWGGYGLMLMERGRPRQAKPYLQKAMAADSDEPKVYEALGQIAFEAGDFGRAESLLRRAVAMGNAQPQAWALLAEVYKNNGQIDQAIDTLQTALAQPSSGVERGLLLAQLGQAYIQKRQWEPAAETFRKAAEYPALRAASSLQAAKSYYFLEQYGQAMAMIDQAGKLRPGDSTVAEWKQKIEDARFGSATSQPTPAGSLLDFRAGPEPETDDEPTTQPAAPDDPLLP